MKIETLKQRVVKATFLVLLSMTAIPALQARELTIDIANSHMEADLAALSGDAHYANLLKTYRYRRDLIKKFLCQFLNKNVNGSPQVFLAFLNKQLVEFKSQVIDKMAGDSNLTRAHKEFVEIYKEFLAFKNVLEANKHQKSAYLVAPKFIEYKHLVFGDIAAKFSADKVLDGLGYRLRQTGNDIGISTTALKQS